MTFLFVSWRHFKFAESNFALSFWDGTPRINHIPLNDEWCIIICIFIKIHTCKKIKSENFLCHHKAQSKLYGKFRRYCSGSIFWEVLKMFAMFVFADKSNNLNLDRDANLEKLDCENVIPKMNPNPSGRPSKINHARLFAL